LPCCSLLSFQKRKVRVRIMLFNTVRAQWLLLCTVHIFPLAMCPNFRTRPATVSGHTRMTQYIAQCIMPVQIYLCALYQAGHSKHYYWYIYNWCRCWKSNGVAGVGYFSNFTVYSPQGDGSCLFTVLSHQLGCGFVWQAILTFNPETFNPELKISANNCRYL